MSKTSPRVEGLIAELKSTARESGAGVWEDVAARLEKPRSTHAEVNLGRIFVSALPEKSTAATVTGLVSAPLPSTLPGTTTVSFSRA